jgi:transposase
MIQLTNNQKTQLLTEAAKTKDLRVYRRATALLALDEGLPPRQVATVLGISRQTVYNWIRTYGQSGDDIDLEDSPRSGRPRLWIAELEGFIRQTMNQSPRQFGYEAVHWTATTLQSHLNSVRDIRISTEALRQYLRLLGYGWKDGRYVLCASATMTRCAAA